MKKALALEEKPMEVIELEYMISQAEVEVKKLKNEKTRLRDKFNGMGDEVDKIRKMKNDLIDLQR